MKNKLRQLKDLDLEIREADINGVIVKDKITGYAVAHFFNQVGAGCVPNFDALELANKFIVLSALLKDKTDGQE